MSLSQSDLCVIKLIKQGDGLMPLCHCGSWQQADIDATGTWGVGSCNFLGMESGLGICDSWGHQGSV